MKPQSGRARAGRLDFVDDFQVFPRRIKSALMPILKQSAVDFEQSQTFIHYLFLLLYSVFDAKALSTLNFCSSSGGAQNGIGSF